MADSFDEPVREGLRDWDEDDALPNDRLSFWLSAAICLIGAGLLWIAILGAGCCIVHLLRSS